MPPKAQPKKRTAPAPTLRLSTRAKNATTHPGLVDLSEDSDPEKSKLKTQKKAAKEKAKAVTKKKEANLPEMKKRIAELEAQIARNDAKVLENEQTVSPGQSSPIEDVDVNIDAVEDIDAEDDVDVTEDAGEIENINIDEGRGSDVVMSDGDGHSGDDEQSEVEDGDHPGGDTDNAQVVDVPTGGPPPGFGHVHYRLRRVSTSTFNRPLQHIKLTFFRRKMLRSSAVTMTAML